MWQLDQQLFLWLNQFHTEWLDPIMLFISYNTYYMGSILIAIIIHGSFKFGKRFAAIFFVALIVFGLSDSISSKGLKDNIKRLRPCHEPVLEDQVHLAGKKCFGGKYGFVSSHASNTFALATFFYLVFKMKIYGFLFLHAALVSYSRIYLAKHYPLDVICGGILGALIAILLFKTLKRFLIPQNNSI